MNNIQYYGLRETKLNKYIFEQKSTKGKEINVFCE